MKLLLVFLFCVVLSGCGTVGGMISGVGQDLQKAGDWMRKK
jgi:predicted small secreted protein